MNYPSKHTIYKLPVSKSIPVFKKWHIDRESSNQDILLCFCQIIVKITDARWLKLHGKYAYPCRNLHSSDTNLKVTAAIRFPHHSWQFSWWYWNILLPCRWTFYPVVTVHLEKSDVYWACAALVISLLVLSFQTHDCGPYAPALESEVSGSCEFVVLKMITFHGFDKIATETAYHSFSWWRQMALGISSPVSVDLRICSLLRNLCAVQRAYHQSPSLSGSALFFSMLMTVQVRFTWTGQFRPSPSEITFVHDFLWAKSFTTARI